jgi:hypothetical protein
MGAEEVLIEDLMQVLALEVEQDLNWGSPCDYYHAKETWIEYNA